MKEEKFGETLSANGEEGGVAVLDEQHKAADDNWNSETERKTESALSAEDRELEALLKTAEEIINTPPPRDPKEIDEKAEQYERLEKRLETLPDISESRLARLERIEKKWREETATRRTAAEFTNPEYESFAESAQGKPLLDNLQKVEGAIAKMEGEERTDDGFKRILEALRVRRDTLTERVANTIFTATQEAFEERIAKARARTHKLYIGRSIELAAQVEELKSDPEVMKRHTERLTEAEAVKEAKRKEAEEKSASERIAADIDLLNETFLTVVSLVNRQKDSFARIKEIAREAGNPQEVRAALTDAILLGEGKQQVKSSAEIAPWKKHFPAAPYIDSLYAARERGSISVPGVGTASHFDWLIVPSDADKKKGVTPEVSQKARTVVDLISKADENDHKLRDTLGNEWEKVKTRDRKTGEMKEFRRQTPLWAAFETRKRNDERGETKRLRQGRGVEEERRKEEGARAAERDRALETQIQKSRDQAGERAVLLRIRGGAVLLEAKKSKKGNTYIEVVDAVGDARAKVKKGSAFPHYSSMPEWLKDIIKGSPYESELDNALEALRKQR